MVDPTHLQRGSHTPALPAGRSPGTTGSADVQPLSLHRLRRVQVQVATAALVAIALVSVVGWLGYRVLTERTAAVVGSYLVTIRDSAARGNVSSCACQKSPAHRSAWMGQRDRPGFSSAS